MRLFMLGILESTLFDNIDVDDDKACRGYGVVSPSDIVEDECD